MTRLLAMFKGPETRHVVPNRKDGRDVRRGGGPDRASSHHDTKQDALDRGRMISRNQNTELRIHNRDGRTGGSDIHGSDPFRPKC